ncbi:hypothetical protein DCCM_4481 [Desulfocucumis palustris]|uniref:Uncharacterized protein n=1 Tax=Desulfocucumis palustris TaxID=1898651 RepID=A0A2L2XGJ6_9FIRM|nr:hypothetical protein [Desulfocucumis palustris]GBF35358.1 hypothetical protein DCCM_4481 [Desulfocucumis palustris]
MNESNHCILELSLPSDLFEKLKRIKDQTGKSIDQIIMEVAEKFLLETES